MVKDGSTSGTRPMLWFCKLAYLTPASCFDALRYFQDSWPGFLAMEYARLFITIRFIPKSRTSAPIISFFHHAPNCTSEGGILAIIPYIKAKWICGVIHEVPETISHSSVRPAAIVVPESVRDQAQGCVVSVRIRFSRLTEQLYNTNPLDQHDHIYPKRSIITRKVLRHAKGDP
ncbi:hypothetical protein BDM02DRAFT_2595234 [Thelephora ganbajun]|uniref:Uncharacterized protein n=1 Tax=Thelephora ganbajun TaxID=370292 RepID=A0ACB6ZT18_THEGA|nr:hypothetical protein BDM02DRAFT_2595234 [Thelephora ganbajun]